MIEITYKDKLKGTSLINFKNISVINYSKEANSIGFWSNQYEMFYSFSQKEVEEDLNDIYQRAKMLLMRG